MSCTPTSPIGSPTSSLSPSEESRFVPRSSIMDEKSFIERYFGSKSEVHPSTATAQSPSTEKASDAKAPAAASFTLPRDTINVNLATSSPAIEQDILHGIDSASRGIESTLAKTTEQIYTNANDDDKSGIVGATIVFTPEPSPPSSPYSASRNSLNQAPSANENAWGMNLGTSEITRNTEGSSNNYIGTIQNEESGELKEGKEHGLGGLKNAVDARSITTEYSLLDGGSSKASKSIAVEDLDEEAEDISAAGGKGEVGEVESKIKDTEAGISTPFKSPTVTDLQAMLDESPHSSLPSLKSHDEPFLPTLISYQTPFKTPKQSTDQDVYQTPSGYQTASGALKDSPAEHRPDESSTNASSAGEFSNMTKSMLRKIRKNVIGGSERIDSNVYVGDEAQAVEEAEDEDVITPFKTLQRYWEVQSSFGLTKSVLGRILFKEAIVGEDSSTNNEISPTPMGSSVDREVGRGKSALFLDEAIGLGNESSGLVAGQVEKMETNAQASPINLNEADSSCEVGTDVELMSVVVQEIFNDGFKLSTRQLVGQLVALGVSFCLVVILLASKATLPIIYASNKLVGFIRLGKLRAHKTKGDVFDGADLRKTTAAKDDVYDFTCLSKSLLGDLDGEARSGNVQEKAADVVDTEKDTISPERRETVEQKAADEVDIVFAKDPNDSFSISPSNGFVSKWVIAFAGLIGFTSLFFITPSNMINQNPSIVPDQYCCLFTDSFSFPAVPTSELSLMLIENNSKYSIKEIIIESIHILDEESNYAEIESFKSQQDMNFSFHFHNETIIDATDKPTPSRVIVLYAAIFSIITAIACAGLFRAKRSKPSKSKKAQVQPSVNMMNTGLWNETEHNQFIKGVEECGCDWKKVAKYITTRTVNQVKTHGAHWIKIGSPNQMKRSKRGATAGSAVNVTPKTSNKVIQVNIAIDGSDNVDLGEKFCNVTPRSSDRRKRMGNQ